MAFDFNLLKAFWYQMRVESKKEAQETIYETSKEIAKEEKYSKLGTLSHTRQIQIKYLASKTKRWIFLVLKALGLKPIMIEKVRFVSCTVAKFLSFINHF